MTPVLLDRYAKPAPRYTSYPTAPHFGSSIGPETYAVWLGALEPQANLSLYVHIPFCDTLCWFCGCSTKITRRYGPVRDYLKAVHKEIANVADLMPPGPGAGHIHWGGGSPTLLAPGDILKLGDRKSVV